MTSKQLIVSVVGTRPNMMKIAPIDAELARLGEFDHVLIHTGQHYDREMSEIFIEQLDMDPPAHVLNVGPGTHAQQTARVMERLEPLLTELAPCLVLVPGDVNSTLGAALTAAKLGIPVGHVEAGLRSFDRTMPEELNRILTDQLSDALFIHSPEAQTNLLAEGRPPSAIFNVGNTMIDTLVRLSSTIENRETAKELGLESGKYLLVTLHRPTLVDTPLLWTALSELSGLAKSLPMVFPVHPRTRARIQAAAIDLDHERIRLLSPLGYIEFLSLLKDAAAVLTDSGGIQEEATYLGIPCFTLRESTERPVTIQLGTNILLGLAPGRIAEIPELLRARRGKTTSIPPLWDGQAAQRIVEILSSKCNSLAAKDHNGLAPPRRAVSSPD
jgi:UDP-N-acetylglucosamine 2-epimerase (non-hydrolysing)